jgi:acyl carrier protein
MPDKNAIMSATKDFILKEFLEGEDPDELTEDVELISSGILDSLATLKLVTFLENEYDVKIEAHEADEDNLNTLADIANLVESKL